MTDIAKYYDHLATEYGPGFKSADAGSQESVEARYKVLSEVCDMNGKHVLEVGCGTGGLALYLKAKYPDIHYTGIDISSKAVAVGKAAHPELNLIHADICEYEPIELLTAKPKTYDCVLAQGIFYLLPTDVNGSRKAIELIRHMVRLSSEVVSFTALCTFPFGPSNRELRIDPIWALGFLGEFSPHLKVDMTYWPGDACFTLYRHKGGL